MPKKRILFIDDDDSVLQTYIGITKKEFKKYDCTYMLSYQEFFLSANKIFDFAFIDWNIGEALGAAIISQIHCPVIRIVSGDDNDYDLWIYSEEKKIPIIKKPFHNYDIIDTVKYDRS